MTAADFIPMWDKLLALTDIMIPSEEFSLGHTGEKDVYKAAEKLYRMYHPSYVVITRGKLGGLLYDGKRVHGVSYISCRGR